jgi:hypothetical protein
MTSRPGRALRATFVLLLAAALAAIPTARVQGADRLGAPSNAQLLLGAVRAVARQLVAQAPVTPGTRVAVRADAGQGVESDVLDALVMALNERRIECVVLEPIGGLPAEASAAPPETTAQVAPAPSAAPGSLSAFTQLQAERAAQAARADSIARAGSTPEAAPAPPPSSPSVMANGGVAANLPVLAYRVAEARVDYVRMYRGGVFGAQRVERRASTRITLKLSSPGSDAVRWSATADTTISDVVMRSEILALEDRLRPETRPVAPTSSLKRLVEPVLVVVLVAGLVSLFYQNRP